MNKLYGVEIQRIELAGLFFLLLAFVLCMGKEVNAEGAFYLTGRLEGYQSVMLQWESNDETCIYQVQRALKPAGTFTEVTSVSGQVGMVSCYDCDVILGSTYYYKAVKLAGNQILEESPVIEMRITLAVPSNIKAEKVKESQVRISWDQVEGAASYDIYRSDTKGNGFRKIGKSDKTEFTDNKVSGGVFYYKVAAVKKKQKAAASTLSEAVAVYLKPGTPEVTGVYQKKKIRITWKKAEGADTYYIYKKNSKGVFKKLGTTNKLYYTDKKVKKGNRYSYKVVAAYSRDGISVKSKKSKVCKVLADVIDPSKKMIALTFDDGPGRYTEDIVNCLKKNSGKATFFVLGCNVDSYKKAIKAADQIGCQIGNHSYNHKLFAKLSEKEIREQISQTDSKVENVIGKVPDLARTPGGEISSTINKNIGKPIILWTIDTLDWKTRDTEKTIKAVMSNIKDGDIVLMHDIHEPTKRAACYLIPKLRQEGYQLVTVSELAKYRGYSLKKNTVYRNLRKK